MLENWLNPWWSEAFAWALLHSLWQGALAACLYAGAARALWSARARYAAAGAALLLALALPVATFYKLNSAPMPRQNSLSNNQLPPEEPLAQLDQTAARDAATTRATVANTTAREQTKDSLRQQAAERFAAWSPVLALLWLSGVLGLSARTLGGWWALRRLCRSAAPAPQRWQEHLHRLAQRVCVSRAVRLCEAALVSVPTALGWLRPVILVPAVAFAGLPPNQLEALLAQELAHLRRHDFLVNLLQIAVETLLFYHPAAWWLSRQIRIEREHVCDDIAVAALGDPFVYAHALTNMELYRRNADWTSVTLAANGGNLMQRIQRLIKPKDAPSRFAGSALMFFLLVTALFGGGFAFNKLTARADSKAVQTKRKVAVGFVSIPATGLVTDDKNGDPYAPMAILLENLKKEQIPAVGFVQGARLYDSPNPADKTANQRALNLLREWRDAGLEIGLGTYRHTWFYGIPVDQSPYDAYVADVLKNEEIVKPILAEKGLSLRYFSYPMLNTGPDLPTKERFEQFLTKQRDYRITKFTIDNDDWIFGRAYDQASLKNNADTMQKITAEYLPYMARIFDFYEGLSREQFGREIPQILLITTNRMTSEQLPALAEMLRERGYEFVTMEEALQDAAYQSPDAYTGKTGISWLQRWSITNGAQWRDEPKPAGYMTQFLQLHKGQGNLKAPPPPPPPPAVPQKKPAPPPPPPPLPLRWPRGTM